MASSGTVPAGTVRRVYGRPVEGWPERGGLCPFRRRPRAQEDCHRAINGQLAATQGSLRLWLRGHVFKLSMRGFR